MNWYIAKIVFRISTEGSVHKDQFDEHLRLIAANSQEEAVLKARMLGLQEEDDFLNDKSQTVKWEFVNVLDVQALQELKDGVELYSQIHEQEQGGEYVHYVHLRAASLHKQQTPVEA